jgi:hypothetical protein
MKTVKHYFMVYSFLFVTLVLSGQTLDWTNAGDDQLWHNSLNWNPEAVPTSTNTVTIGDIATSENAVVLSGPSAVCENLTLDGSNGGTIEVSADLTVGNTLLLANAKQGRFIQTAGVTTITGALNTAYSSSGKALLSVSGRDSVFNALGSTSFSRYRGAETLIEIKDGATAVFENNVTFSGEGGVPSSTLNLEVRDGALLQVNANLLIGGGGTVSATVSNASLIVDGHLYGRYAAVNFQSNSIIKAKTIRIGQYQESNTFFVQEPFSQVVLESYLRITGCEQGGAAWGTNNVYEMRGGLLIVSNGMNVANNGHGIFRQTGGVAEIRTGDIVIQTQTNTGSDLVLPDSVLEVSENAVFKQMGGTLFIGSMYGSSPARLVIEGNTPQISVRNLKFRGGSICPVIGPDGVAPLTVMQNAEFLAGCAVLPEAMPGASTSPQVILTWDGTATTPENLLLHPDVVPAQWKLTVDTANKQVLLRYRFPGTLLFMK